jgi:hypothetical protein
MTIRQKGHIGPEGRPVSSSFSIHLARHILQLLCMQLDRTTSDEHPSKHSGQILESAASGAASVVEASLRLGDEQTSHGQILESAASGAASVVEAFLRPGDGLTSHLRFDMASLIFGKRPMIGFSS